jgi:alkylated DNA repair dioxygenase AlkB
VPELHLSRQPTLFDQAVAVDATFDSVERIDLGEGCWLDVGRGWLGGDGELFDELLESVDWGQRTRWMYTREVIEPRLTARLNVEAGRPLVPAPLEQMRLAFNSRYGRCFDSVGMNLYRDGDDSVAWHRDKIPNTISEPVVALVSVGARRAFALRPLTPPRRARTLRFDLGAGDLLVTGGRTQRLWEHSVPKVRSAGPRISLAFRHSEEPARAPESGRPG